MTEVRIGIDTEEMMPPMITGTFLTWTSWRGGVDRDVALALVNRECRSPRLQPRTPPASLMSRKAISTDFAPA